MFKKSLCVLMVLSMAFLFTGCWNYRGLNEIALVVGIGIDKNPQNGDFHVVFEIVDLTSEAGSIKTKLIEAEGKTIFDAGRNAKKRLTNKLFYGDTLIVVIGNEIAKKEGLNSILDWFLRDAETRETISIVISQEKTAQEILSIMGIDQSMVADEIDNIVELDQEVTASTEDVELYNIYNILKGKGISLVLPAIHLVLNDEEPAVEVNGIAVFKQDKLVGYLNPIESKYYLFAVNEVKGGLLTLSSTNDESYDITLEISENKSKTSYIYEDGKIKVTIKIETKVYLAEYANSADMLEEKLITSIQEKAQKMINENVKAVIKKTQDEYDSDIFGIGNMIYKKNPKLWDEISMNWTDMFSTMDVEVQSKVVIINTALTKKS